MQTEINNNNLMAAFRPIGTAQIIRIVSYSIRKMAVVHVICKKNVSCPPPENRLQR